MWVEDLYGYIQHLSVFIIKPGKEGNSMNFITISEMIGTQGRMIARDVANTLNYTYYGREALMRAADEMGVLSDILKMELKSPPLLEKFLSDKPKIHLDRFQALIYEVAKKGNAVFFGKGSQLLLNSFDCALHVLVTGSMGKRKKRVMEEMNVDAEVAEKMVLNSDQYKKEFLKYAYNDDWLNPELYHLILNTDVLSTDSAVKIIVDAAKSEEIKSCGVDAVQRLGKFALQRKIESTLLEAGVMSLHLFFSVDDVDSVRIFGVAASREEKENIERLLRGIKGIKNVTNDLRIGSDD
jgi:cytidylate kinase